MKRRIFAIMAVLAGAAAGIAVTADNYYWYRKAKEAENEGEWNLTTASELCARADIAHEQSYLLQNDMMDFAELSDADKEKVKALIRKLAREEKDGPDVPDMRQTEDGSTNCKTAAEADGSADLPSESAFSDDTAPHDVAQATAEDKDEMEKLVAEYLRRVENAYGHSKESRMLAPYARPVRNSRTGYAYIGTITASKKTGLSARDIHRSCVSNNGHGGEWCYISQTEYAKMPEEKIEVDMKDRKAEEEKNNDSTAPVTPQIQSGSESDTPQAASENEKRILMAEYWRRAINVYGHGDSLYGFVKNAKPVYHCGTGYAYISVDDAAKKIGYPANYIRECCDIPDPMGQLLFSDERKGGVFRYISQTEYAKMPEYRIEVETKDQKKDNDDFSDESVFTDDTIPVAPQAKSEDEECDKQKGVKKK